MTIAILCAGALGIVSSLILVIQRNAARASADKYLSRAILAEEQLGIERKSAQEDRSKHAQIVQNLHDDIMRLTVERNELIKMVPGGAGRLLAGVLAPNKTKSG